MLGKVVLKLVEIPAYMFGTICDFLEKLGGDDGRQWFAEFKNFLRKQPCWTEVAVESMLRLLSGGENLTIDATDGQEILAEAGDVFVSIDGDFKNWGADEKSCATEEVPVDVYEIAKDGTFAQLFGSLNADVRKLCLTQAQIMGFVKKHRNQLRTEGYGNFFLFESNSEVFVATVGVFSGGRLDVRVDRFDDSYVWRAGYRHRVVVPQLA